jgi:DNA mismatch repair ATPase MutS
LSNQSINKILEDDSLDINKKYFKFQQLLEKKYGKDSVVLLRTKNYYKAYEVNNDEEQIGQAKNIARILNIQLNKKNNISKFTQQNPLTIKIKPSNLEKYLTYLIQEHNYTIAIITKNKNSTKLTLQQIISPGVNFDFVANHQQNNITSLVVNKIKNNYTIGYSTIDVTTGICYYCEITGSNNDPYFVLDEVLYYTSIHTTSQVLLTFLNDNIDKEFIINYLELSNIKYHILNNTFDLNYQNKLFKNKFNINSLLTPIEHLCMENDPLSAQSLAILLDFIGQQNDKIIQDLPYPTKIDPKQYLYLGNNALKQLNIAHSSTQQSSLIELIDNTSTFMGKRLLRLRIIQPIKDEERLKKRYELSTRLYDYYQPIENYLYNICDIQRVARKLKLGKINPAQRKHLINSLKSIKRIVIFMENYGFIKPPCSSDELEILQNNIINKKNQTQDIKLLDKISIFIAKIDVAISNIKTSKRYNYKAPKIVQQDHKDHPSFIEIISLRHPILETNKSNDTYIPNDIILGDLNKTKQEYTDNIILKNSKPLNITANHITGVLLYGINSSGKSSFMKSLGISIVLAQAGFFVPASSMRFTIFDKIFTRINGDDNITRGLSSFSVEMIELKNIFIRATKNSLILGDEISHSTETLSGV